MSSRTAFDQRHSRARDGRGAEGEFRSPGNADGAGAAGRRVVDAGHEVRRGRSRLARPRSVRSFGRPRVDAALLDALPHRASGSSSTTSASSVSWGSRTPGHPEKNHTKGVEVTTGPLGQGIGDAVGIAIAEKNLRARFGAEVCDHRVFGICSDGDLMEGISHEAAIARRAPAARSPRVRLRRQPHHDRRRHRARVQRRRSEAVRGLRLARRCSSARSPNDTDALEAGLRAAIAEEDRPSLLVLRSHIGYPSPKVQDTAAAHGNPLGADEVARVKEILGLPPGDFVVPDDVLDRYRRAGSRGAEVRTEWTQRRTAWLAANPARADEYEACIDGRPLGGWEQKLPTFEAGKQIPTREASQEVLTAVADLVPGIDDGIGRPHRQQRPGGEEPRRHDPDRREWARHPLRNPRARDGRSRERHGGVGLVARGRHLLRVQRLHAAGGSARGDHGHQGRVRVDARLGRCRRRRSDPPADRAARVVARDAGLAGHPSRGCERGRAGVARAPRRCGPDRVAADPPEDPGARGHRRARSRGSGAWCVRTRRRSEWSGRHRA